MMRMVPPPMLAALLALPALGGCFDDPYATPLSELDLSDMSAVSKVAAALSPEDQGLFKTYAIRHSAQTKFACGNIERHHHGKKPETIAEALAMTRQWETEDAARKAANTAPDPSKMSAEDRFEYELEQLRLAYREVADRQANIMASSVDSTYRQSEDWKQSEIDLQEAIARLEEKQAKRP